MAKKKPAAASVAVDSHKHVADRRPNIPTRETAAFSDDGVGRAVYERDRSLDPQLVWKGKDEQDARPLEVPAVPLHVQEKIHPQAIVEDLKRRAAAPRPAADVQLDLFADFNGLDDFAKKLEFYQHDQHWTNRLILGDSLLVMASLAEKERLRGQVQCIFFDPPYGIKFGSNWQVSTRKRDVKDAKAEDLTRQPEQIRAFRDTWQLGIHSYLTYMRDRLTAARSLLTDSGSIFVQIGDENVHLIRSLMDEIFGSENFCALITFKKTSSASSEILSGVSDYLLWYAKTHDQVKMRSLYALKNLSDSTDGSYDCIESPDAKSWRRMRSTEKSDVASIPPGWRVFMAGAITSSRPPGSFPVQYEGKTYVPSSGYWKTGEAGFKQLVNAKRLVNVNGNLRYRRYFNDFPVSPINNLWTDTTTGTYTEAKVYVVQTNTKVVERCILMTTDPGDLVIDPTCGSGTTAHVAEQWGRRWITIDTSRVALALARTRLMAARFPYYLLADSPEGRKKQAELTGAPSDPNGPALRRDIHKGFVYRTVPHVTLKSIANNPDIKEGMTREQIDQAIARHADTETLYDQPYEDKNVVRLTGPFTVESLSPHRSLPIAPADDEPAAPEPASAPVANPSFGQMILDNLSTAGVKGTDKAQRITLARLDPFPGEYIHAEGETDAGAAVRVCIGPEFGTLGDADIKKAALEAIKGSRCDLLLVCAFAFEASVHEQTAELTKEIKFGKLAILPVRMNPDLAMGDELLKKTGAGNLFTVFGEPDVKLTAADGKLTVEIRGVDVFDPGTGAVRTGDVDDIACWFLDTDYDGQSFFVRHAYFLYGGKDTKEGPYDKLKKALRAEIDEGEWSKLYSAVSQPFPVPTTGKIAVKVINHFGDEVLKVYTVPPAR
ncbi:site-specific DNA-methyltransferase [Planctomyces sp. SH-PL62]|uniref:site-specific DNA-methyltransferase n=1 Tax=Planctomyces sp. SH-PL62 TaxID=1636152 RepID=UPI00078C9414|nr:site-specific DNA-methyltransferase [Planctomyces sp. SH-PL62]AMV38777.1 Modification methylase DpnIIB [Planctomyces sp. SH-PL62]